MRRGVYRNLPRMGGAELAQRESKLHISIRRRDVQFTIEARELTTETTLRSSSHSRSRRTTIEAQTPDDAISQFVMQNHSELVSVSRPARGLESIATVKKDDSVFLVRVYAA